MHFAHSRQVTVPFEKLTQHQCSNFGYFQAPKNSEEKEKFRKITPHAWVIRLVLKAVRLVRRRMKQLLASLRVSRTLVEPHCLPKKRPTKKCVRGRRPFSQWYHARKGVCLG